MSTKGKKSVENENNVGEILSKSEKFIEKNQKIILTVVGVAILLVVAILGVRHMYLIPREKEAEASIFKGETYFSRDQWDLALYGDSIDYIGFEEIINEYGSTKTGNLAKAYAGICYFHKGQPEQALEYLKKFSSNDKMVSPAIIGLIGDCYVELDKVKEGISYFEKAASKADNDLISPVYLKKAGIAYENQKNYSQAVNSYLKIKNQYPLSNEATDIDKYIERARLASK